MVGTEVQKKKKIQIKHVLEYVIQNKYFNIATRTQFLNESTII